MPVPTEYSQIVGAEASFYTTLAAAISTGISGVGLDAQIQTTTLSTGQDEIIVTVNGGILPTSNSKMLLLWENGVVDLTTTTIDRVTEPNSITLDTPVDSDVIFTLLIFV